MASGVADEGRRPSWGEVGKKRPMRAENIEKIARPRRPRLGSLRNRVYHHLRINIPGKVLKRLGRRVFGLRASDTSKGKIREGSEDKKFGNILAGRERCQQLWRERE